MNAESLRGQSGVQHRWPGAENGRRRALLDELLGQDGQSLVALHSTFDVTRIDLAKHLGLLPDAGLVITTGSSYVVPNVRAEWTVDSEPPSARRRPA